MAYVIAVCGSGGKTTLVKSLAKKYANENKKVCITTTTHMWYDEDVKESLIVGIDANVAGADTISSIVGAKLCEPKHIALNELLSKNQIKSGRVYYIANVNNEKELITPLNESDYKTICEKFDYVIIEADGSRSMPMKVPRMKAIGIIAKDVEGESFRNPRMGELCEPAISSNTNEIIIVVGKEAIGREIGAVCHRFKEFYGNDKYLSDKKIKPETIVTDELLDDFVKHYYYEPLKQKFCKAKTSIYKNDFVGGSLSSPIRIGLAQLTHTVGASYTSAKQGLYCSPVRIAIVLCASGFSKRFGSNKLLIDASNIEAINANAYHIVRDNAVEKNIICSSCRGELCEPKRVSKKLYQLMIDKLLNAKEMLINKFDNLYEIDNESKRNLQLNDAFDKNNLKNQKKFDIDIVVVSQYDEILNDNNYKDKVIMLRNDKASEGLSASIKLGVEYCVGSHSSPVQESSHSSPIQENSQSLPVQGGSTHVHPYDAVVFVNADLPHLPDTELANFIFNSILNKNGIAVMYSDDYKNPAYFEKKYFDDLMALSGDKGARELFDKYKMNVYKYYISDKYLLDIDTKEDLEKVGA